MQKKGLAVVAVGGNALILDKDLSKVATINMPHFGNTYSVQASELIFKGGLVKKSIEISALREQLAELDHEKDAQNIKFLVMSTYLGQVFRDSKPQTQNEVRAAVLVAAQRRVRPCLMTSATTILALIPILTSVGRGSDVMVPMAIPSFGGMTIEIMTMLVVPVLYCWAVEWKLKLGIKDPRFAENA